MRRIILVLLILLVAAAASAAARATGPERLALAQSVTYAPGWNLVAGPQGAHLTGATGQLYTLQPGDTQYATLPADATLTACAGYWAFFPNGGSLVPGPLGGGTVSCSLNISPAQFVMMGNPSTSTSVAVNGADVVYTYTPAAGYQNATRLEPGQGAWVYAAGAVSITVAGAASASGAAATPAPAAAAGEMPVGPLAISASLSVTTCGGGNVGVTVHVLDANGNGVEGASVTGTVHYQTTSQDFNFPATDASGTTRTDVDMPVSSGGYTVEWTFTVTSGGLSAMGSTSCFAP